MRDWQGLSHVRWECKYHVVFVPKYRKRRMYGKVRGRVGEIIRDLCRRRGVEVLKGHPMPDHVHMSLSVPPKFSIAFVIGFLKSKSAVRIRRQVLRERRTTGLHFWARGYCVSTVGLDEEAVRKYIREQEELEKQQMELQMPGWRKAPTGLSSTCPPPLGGFLRPPAMRAEPHSVGTGRPHRRIG